MRVLEIGCAPGKHLAYLAKIRGLKFVGSIIPSRVSRIRESCFEDWAWRLSFVVKTYSPARSRSGHLIWYIASGWLSISATPNPLLKGT